MKQKIVIFGATGGTGQELVKQALAQNYTVTAFVRNPQKLKLRDENLQIIQGNVLNQLEVDNALRNQDAVFCNLGMPASDKSKLRTKGTSNIIKAMEKHSVSRLICQTSLGFGDSKEILPWHMKYIIVPFILKNAFIDHEEQEQKVEKSALDWTIVRPGNMTNGEKTEKFLENFDSDANVKLKISRADVAYFMLNQLGNNQYLHSKVGLSY